MLKSKKKNELFVYRRLYCLRTLHYQHNRLCEKNFLNITVYKLKDDLSTA